RKTGEFDQLVDDVVGRHQRLTVEGTRPGRQRQEMVIAADVARPDELVVENEPAHQEKVGGVKPLFRASGQAVMALEDPELFQRRLLFLFSVLRKRLLEGRATAIGPVVGGK